MEVMVTTGGIRSTKLQSKCYHHQTNIQLFSMPDALPVAQPAVSEHWRENFIKHWSMYCIQLSDRRASDLKNSCICSPCHSLGDFDETWRDSFRWLTDLTVLHCWATWRGLVLHKALFSLANWFSCSSIICLVFEKTPAALPIPTLTSWSQFPVVDMWAYMICKIEEVLYCLNGSRQARRNKISWGQSNRRRTETQKASRPRRQRRQDQDAEGGEVWGGGSPSSSD